MSLRPGHLAYCDITVRAMDNSDLAMSMGSHGGAAMKLMESEWRNGGIVEYAKFRRFLSAQ